MTRKRLVMMLVAGGAAALLVALLIGQVIGAQNTPPALPQEVQLQLENKLLRLRILQGEASNIGMQIGTIIQEFEAKHAGYTITADVSTLNIQVVAKQPKK